MAEYVNNIKKCREDKNMTQADLAESLGTNVRNVRRWENGESSMDVITAMKIAKILNVKFENLFEFDKEDI